MASADAVLIAPDGMHTVAVRSWRSFRDDRVVKQEKDYSCGAASLATILTEHYRQQVTEEDLLAAMDNGDLRASLGDMANALTRFGFRGVGYAVSFGQLAKLKMPVVVHLRHRKDDHFSVLRGVGGAGVRLADPALGNRYFSRDQFLEMWETRDDPSLKGRIFAVLPLERKAEGGGFFSPLVAPPTALGEAMLQVRSF